MIDAWKDLLSSKKFWTAILAVVTLVAAKKGVEVDQTTFWAIAGIFVSLIGAQGLTDHGKGALPTATARVRRAAAPSTPSAVPPAAPSTPEVATGAA